jgi:hypothetical protein
MCPKEDLEILTVKKACLVSVDVFTKYLKDQILEIIDNDKVRFHWPKFDAYKLYFAIFNKIFDCLK